MQDQNKTEQATPFKLSEAKKKGQVAKSMDVNTLVVVGGLLTALSIWGELQWQHLLEFCARVFAAAGSLQSGDDALMQVTALVGRELLWVVGPFAAAGFVVAVAANVIQTGFILSAEPLKPKFERINPVAGFKRVFNKRMLFEALKSLMKLAFFGAIGYAFFKALWPTLPNAASADIQWQISWLASNAMTLLVRFGVALAVIGLADLLLSRWQFSKQMMMSKHEVKEEIKRRDGDPHIRAKIRELQRENLKQAKSMGRVPEADVLITNPTHFAVALRYVRNEMNAPVVIAKGSDNWAAEMKVMARKHGIAIFERRKLARELFRAARIDAPIPLECFVEVARVYADLGKQRAERTRYEVAR